MSRLLPRRAILALVAACCAAIGCDAPAESEPSVTAVAPGMLVLDTRDPADFAAGHHAGALNIQLSYGQLDGRVASYIPDRATPIAVHAGNAVEAARAMSILGAKGYTDVRIAEPVDASDAARLATIDAQALRAELDGPTPPLVVDVRTAKEYARGTIADALLFEQDEAPAWIDRLDRDRRIAVICEGGWRSSQFASLLAREGFPDVVNVIDGMAGWRALAVPSD